MTFQLENEIGLQINELLILERYSFFKQNQHILNVSWQITNIENETLEINRK